MDTGESQDRRPGALGVHSVDRFVLSLPSLDEAVKFFKTFGLDTRVSGKRLDIYTFGSDHCWGSFHESGKPRRMEYLTLGIYAEDEAAFARRIDALGIRHAPHPLSDGKGLWLRDPDGLPIQLLVAPKVAPSKKAVPILPPAVSPGDGAAPPRSRTAAVHPRRLSHVLRFSPDVPRMRKFCEDVLGMRFSDGSGDLIAFMHGAHGSDHHLLAFVKSDAPGFHHSSWDVGNVDHVGWGAETMRSAGYTDGWGVGRHVLGSNYFYYVRDPWGSFAEYSFDIDHVPATVEWHSGDHAPEDSFYMWGPAVPDYFVTNYESSTAQEVVTAIHPAEVAG